MPCEHTNDEGLDVLEARTPLNPMHSKDGSFVNESVGRNDFLMRTNCHDSTFHFSLVHSFAVTV